MNRTKASLVVRWEDDRCSPKGETRPSTALEKGVQRTSVLLASRGAVFCTGVRKVVPHTLRSRDGRGLPPTRRRVLPWRRDGKRPRRSWYATNPIVTRPPGEGSHVQRAWVSHKHRPADGAENSPSEMRQRLGDSYRQALTEVTGLSAAQAEAKRAELMTRPKILQRFKNHSRKLSMARDSGLNQSVSKRQASLDRKGEAICCTGLPVD